MSATAAARTQVERGGLAPAHMRFGWTALVIGLAFGVTLEAILGWKWSAYLLDPIRQDLWRLAHFHVSMLALVNLVYVPWADRNTIPVRARNIASRSLLAGSVLLPLGFFLGGLAHFEGDPGFGIFLAPPGALLVLVAAVIQARAAWRAN